MRMMSNFAGLFSVACIVTAPFTSCKPSAPSSAPLPSGTAPSDSAGGLYASSEPEVRSTNTFFYALFKKNYERNIDALPATGAVTSNRTPYAGSYYPQVLGGTNIRMQGPSPLEKYDAVFNTNASAKAVDWEKANHTIASTDPNAGWAGHCNGFSAASSRHAEPANPVTVGSTTFYPVDIKALLAEIYMSDKFYYIGGARCNDPSVLTSPANRADPWTFGTCDQMNPATFHIAVSNWIGIQQYPIIADIHGRGQVWNYPHWKYTSTNTKISRASANQLITGDSTDTYPFNPAAVNFRSVSMTITYSNDYQNEQISNQVPVAQRYIDQTHTYVLELDSNNLIVGGEWIGNSQTVHPDFMWVAMEPTPGDGSVGGANPNLDPNQVLKLWAQSMGADPNNPPSVLMMPPLPSGWGQFPMFNLLVQGLSNGVVFAVDNKMDLTLTPSSALSGATPQVNIDGTGVTFDTSASPKATVTNPSNGLHVIRIQWVAGGKIVDDQRARFEVVK